MRSVIKPILVVVGGLVLLGVVFGVVSLNGLLPNGTHGTAKDRGCVIGRGIMQIVDDATGVTVQKLDEQALQNALHEDQEDIVLLKNAIESCRTGKYTAKQWKETWTEMLAKANARLVRLKTEGQNLVAILEKSASDPDIKSGRKTILINGDRKTLSELTRMGTDKERQLQRVKKQIEEYGKQISTCDKTYVALVNRQEIYKLAVEEAQSDHAIAQQQVAMLDMQRKTAASAGLGANGADVMERLKARNADIKAKVGATVDAESERLQEQLGSDIGPDILSPAQVAESLKAHWTVKDDPKNEAVEEF